MRNLCLMLACAALLAGCSSICFKGKCGEPTAVSDVDPNATTWSGTWKDTRADDHGGDLHCTASPTNEDGTAWTARFYGMCSREFEYHVDLEGKAEGDKIVFSGDVDLGEKDGGVYTWSGAIEGDTFNGEYSTVRGKAGFFEMTRKQ